MGVAFVGTLLLSGELPLLSGVVGVVGVGVALCGSGGNGGGFGRLLCLVRGVVLFVGMLFSARCGRCLQRMLLLVGMVVGCRRGGAGLGPAAAQQCCREQQG